MVRRRLLPLGGALAGMALLAVPSPLAAAEEGGPSSFDILPSLQLAQDVVERYMLPPEPASSSGGSSSGEGNGTTPPTGPQPSGEVEEASTSTPDTEADAEAKAEEDRNLKYDGSDLLDWINDNGGFVHPNVRIGLDPTGQYRGVFVKTLDEGGTEEGIDEGDITARIPWDLIVKPKEYDPSVYWSCEALHELYRQFQLGDESPHAPYINYLKNQPRGRIPSEWSDAGKELLRTILDHTDDDDEDDAGLPPRHFLKEFTVTYLGECEGEDTELARAAFYQFTSRDEDTLMVPFYDMHNHSNDPKKLNSLPFKPPKAGKPFVMRTTRRVEPGEQLFISYNRCNRQWYDESYRNCPSWSHYGTSHLFDIFGFVEEFPQSWDFRMHIEVDGEKRWDDVAFYLEKSDDGRRLLVTFGDNYTEDPDSEKPILENIVYFGQQLIRLKELEASAKDDEKMMESMPRHEWDMAWRYHEALMTAISAAILASDFAYEDDEEGAFSGVGSEDESGDEGESGDSTDDSEDDSGDAGEEDESEDEDRHDEL